MMETGWEQDFGMETGMENSTSPAKFTGASPAYMYGIPTAESLRVDDLLDFTNHELFPSSSSSSSCLPTEDAAILLPSGKEFSSTAVAVGFDPSFPNDIYIPSEEAAELEWLSKFVEDSFSDTPYHYSVTNTTMSSENRAFPASEISVHGGLASRINRSSEISPSSSSSSSFSSTDLNPKAKTSELNKTKQGKNDGGTRRCTHCSSEKTPQWRTGPLGPKTLCNACGVRFKSGRLVPEYRPAASPTFVLTQHSNSHRKVIELRRQKEFLILRGGNGGDGGDGGFSPAVNFEDYEVC